MTVGEFKAALSAYSDETPLAVACESWVDEHPEVCRGHVNGQLTVMVVVEDELA